MKKLNGTLVGVNGNAFAIMGYFQKEAKKQGWTVDQIAWVLRDARDWDYEHLLKTINDCFE